MNQHAASRVATPRLPDLLSRPFGLDLGTSRVRGAAFLDGAPRPIEDAGNASGFPAVACFHGGTTRVGRAALGYGASHPRETVVDVLRLLGRAAAERPRSGPAPRAPWSSFSRASGELRALSGASAADLEETAALLMRQPVDALGARLGVRPGPVVLAAPAWLGAEGRAALVAAARRAEMPLPLTITDVVARALSLAPHVTTETRAAIVDVGAGGVSAAIVSMSWRRVDVRGVAGDGTVGGADVDAAIRRAIGARLPPEAAAIAEGPDYALALRALAESVKRDLGVADPVYAPVPFLRGPGGEPLSVCLDRASLVPLLGDLVARVRAVVAEALRAALLPASAVRQVHAAGGMARVPEVLAAIERPFAVKAQLRLGSDSVACGAALRAAMLDGAVDLVLDEGDVSSSRSGRASAPPPRTASVERVRVPTIPIGLLAPAADAARDAGPRAATTVPSPRRTAPAPAAQAPARTSQPTTERRLREEPGEEWALTDEEIESAFAAITSRPSPLAATRDARDLARGAALRAAPTRKG